MSMFITHGGILRPSRNSRCEEPGLGINCHVRFSNRPFEVKRFQTIEVKRFQTIRRCGIDVTHGLVLLFGIGTNLQLSTSSPADYPIFASNSRRIAVSQQTTFGVI